jgi:DNA-binding response OmpR family regulator
MTDARLSSPPERIRVLIVDDEEDFASAIAERLGRRGFEATAAFSARAGLALLEEITVDVVVLDLKMPGMDGLTALGRIRKLHPDVQVIVLTGHGTVAAGIEGMQLGAADFLQKPVTIEVLGTAITAAAERSRASRAAAGPGEEEGDAR